MSGAHRSGAEPDGDAQGGTRPEPLQAYVPNGRVLSVPRQGIDAVFQVLRPYARRRVEAGMFFYGERYPNGDTLVRSVVVPRQENHWGNYYVSAQAMAEVALATNDTDWVNIAQLHTHPGTWVDHSPYDDRVANSIRAISVVIPRYGRDASSWPSALGVHEWQEGHWHRLDTATSASRIQVVDELGIQLIDLT